MIQEKECFKFLFPLQTLVSDRAHIENIEKYSLLRQKSHNYKMKVPGKNCLFAFFFFFFVFFPFFGPLPRHMDVPRLGVKSEL